ncbi:MAG: hypothetical protein HY509_04025, partial [Acidobacteria bacterium]|nr:hypothetical protein [Acidobacteriota bacterium]
TATVAAAAAVALSGRFLAEFVAEKWTGFRFPWYARQEISLATAVTLAAATTWLSLRLFRRIRPAEEPEPFLAAAGFLLAAGAAAGFGSGFPEAGFLCVPPLAGIVAGLPAKRAGPRLFAALLGWAHLPGLVSPRAYRAALRFAGLEVPVGVGFLVLLLLLLPLALVLFGLLFRPDRREWRWALHPNALAACLVGYAACFGGWRERPSYDGEHRRTIRVEEWADLERGEAGIDLASQENLRGIRILRPAPEAIDPAGRTWSRRLADPPDLLSWKIAESPDPDAIRAVTLTLELERPADRVRVRFRSRGGFLLPTGEAEGSGGGWSEVDRLEWRYAHELTRLEERYRLWPAAPESPLTVELEVEFEADWFGWEFEAQESVFVHRGRVRAAQTLPALAR